VEVDGLTPIDPRLKILGASSDYLVMDVTAAGDSVRVGDRIAFSLNYGALLAVMSSQYVEKRPLRRASSMETAR
jgi:predicted amino acid racemase